MMASRPKELLVDFWLLKEKAAREPTALLPSIIENQNRSSAA
jgi:hypothetical protein